MKPYGVGKPAQWFSGERVFQEEQTPWGCVFQELQRALIAREANSRGDENCGVKCGQQRLWGLWLLL